MVSNVIVEKIFYEDFQLFSTTLPFFWGTSKIWITNLCNQWRSQWSTNLLVNQTMISQTMLFFDSKAFSDDLLLSECPFGDKHGSCTSLFLRRDCYNENVFDECCDTCFNWMEPANQSEHMCEIEHSTKYTPEWNWILCETYHKVKFNVKCHCAKKQLLHASQWETSPEQYNMSFWRAHLCFL